MSYFTNIAVLDFSPVVAGAFGGGWAEVHTAECGNGHAHSGIPGLIASRNTYARTTVALAVRDFGRNFTREVRESLDVRYHHCARQRQQEEAAELAHMQRVIAAEQAREAELDLMDELGIKR